MYRDGAGIGKDLAETLKWHTLASHGGNGNAQFNLAGMYLNGEGVEQDYAKALPWLQRAALQNHARAKLQLESVFEYMVPPAPGTLVTIILLSGQFGARYTSRRGIVVTPCGGTVVKVGKAAVLLDGEANAITFKCSYFKVNVV